MRPSKFLRAISLQFPARLSPSLVLSALHCRSTLPGESYVSAPWLMGALNVAVAIQKVALVESLSNISIRECDRNPVENYLEDAVELLDACNGLCNRMETVNEYVQALRIVLHSLEGRSDPNATMLKRASVVLKSCEAMERKCAELEKCSSSLGSWVKEVLNGSKAIALFACGVFGIALSFKTKRGLPAPCSFPTTSWSSSLHELHKEVKEEVETRKKLGSVVLVELRETVNATKTLRDLINLRLTVKKATHHIELDAKVEDLRRSCGKLEEWIKPLQEIVNELYRNLISTRVALLDVLSCQ
ncbi:hypothetical protein AQUCO_01400055v1 [Aquilegia coerulea]|uniref:Uncharacterized protein n=1 Tax=Aquilegia coerulea TaxID=218851 RepID=A0A2G5DUB8_AQUCA|nr:hypothetical protein AQUCO_01400055v1 [Aquilegia coerulea]